MIPHQLTRASGGLDQSTYVTMPLEQEKNNSLTWADYELFLAARYIAGGYTRETALCFAHGEITAILARNHWTQGEPTPAVPRRLILNNLSSDELEHFTERARILEHDAGMSRSDAESGMLREIINRKHLAATPKKMTRTIYQGAAAIKHVITAGIGIKYFFAKGGDHDPAAYITNTQQITAMWNEGVRRFKAFLRGKFLVIDIDRKPGKLDGLETFYLLFPRDTLPEELQNLPDSFPCYTKSPSNGFHLYFKYTGPELKLSELAPGIEIKEWQITCPGSRKENGEYVLHGDLSDAPPLYGLIIDAIEEAKRKREQAKAERSKPRNRTAADRPVRYPQPRITLDNLANETVAAHGGHHDRQVSFSGRACRCKFSAAETLAYVKSRADIFGNDTDTENTVVSVFRDNGGYL